MDEEIEFPEFERHAVIGLFLTPKGETPTPADMQVLQVYPRDQFAWNMSVDALKEFVSALPDDPHFKTRFKLVWHDFTDESSRPIRWTDYAVSYSESKRQEN